LCHRSLWKSLSRERATFDKATNKVIEKRIAVPSSPRLRAAIEPNSLIYFPLSLLSIDSIDLSTLPCRTQWKINRMSNRPDWINLRLLAEINEELIRARTSSRDSSSGHSIIQRAEWYPYSYLKINTAEPRRRISTVQGTYPLFLSEAIGAGSTSVVRPCSVKHPVRTRDGVKTRPRSRCYSAGSTRLLVPRRSLLPPSFSFFALFPSVQSRPFVPLPFFRAGKRSSHRDAPPILHWKYLIGENSGMMKGKIALNCTACWVSTEVYTR